MKKILAIFALFLVLAAGTVIAHHPAEDIVDAVIYAMIDEMVSDTPHATMEFDEDMGTTTITADSVSAAENLINDGLIATLSLLDEDVTVTITYGPVVETASISEATENKDQNQGEAPWTERNDWGREVTITVDTLLKETDEPSSEL